MLESDNDHHVIEASFKALARALRQAITPLPGNEYLSTKGVLDEN
jgi:imidazoleglycerol phosphate dehydratase HisB